MKTIKKWFHTLFHGEVIQEWSTVSLKHRLVQYGAPLPFYSVQWWHEYQEKWVPVGYYRRTSIIRRWKETGVCTCWCEGEKFQRGATIDTTKPILVPPVNDPTEMELWKEYAREYVKAFHEKNQEETVRHVKAFEDRAPL